MFDGCYNLRELPNLSRWNVENVVSMAGMFYNAKNIKSIPGIEKWNPIKLKTCSKMFFGCKSLKSSEVEKIEKWTNVEDKIKKEAYNGYIYANESDLNDNFIDKCRELFFECICFLTFFLLLFRKIKFFLIN